MIEFACTSCGKQLKVKDEAAGKKGKCPQCGVMLQVPDVHSQPPLEPPPRLLKTIEESLSASGTNAPDPQPEPLKRQRAAVVASDGSTEQYDQPTKIAMGAGGLGLLILALSPLFRWINFGGGGVTGISGDGKLVLGVTVVSIILFALAVFARKRLTTVSLGVGAWGTVALFWMGGLIWKVGSILESPDVKDNPFTAIFATQISPGSGLYLGLVGGLIVAGALGFLAFRRLQPSGRPWFFYISQACALALGVLVAVAVGPDGQPTPSGSTPPSSGRLSGEPKEKVTTIALGEETRLGQVLVKVLGAWKGPISFEVKGSFSSQSSVRDYSTPVLMLALQITNISEGQVFSVAPSHSDPWELCRVTDTYGNRNLASGVAQFKDWPPSSLQVGQQPTSLKPGENTVLVFMVDELDKPDADTFTWSVDCYTDNQFSKHKISVMTPANQVQFPRAAVEAQIEHLRSLQAAAEAAKASRAKFVVDQARFYFSKDRFSSDPVIELTVTNGTGKTVSRFYCRGVLSSPGRETPWVDDTFNYSVRGGIQPDETQQFRLAPNMFGPWSRAPKDRQDLAFAVTVYRLDGPDESELFPSQWSEENANRLAALENILRERGR